MSHLESKKPVPVVYYGSETPLPEQRTVRAGPLQAVLEEADLRYIAAGDDVVIFRLYAAIRDQSWGTIAPVFTAYELEQDETSFSLRFTAEHVSGGEQGVDFVWDGSIAGSSDGTIVCTMDGSARSPFKRNRIGWCVLHPMELAGRPVRIQSGDQTRSTAFPELISPHQPFLDIEAMEHGVAGGGTVRIAFAGDVFENEDQRNWTDASYKTYSTPLRIPYPVQLQAGDRVWQSVTVSVSGVEQTASAARDQPGLSIHVGAEMGNELPGIGLASAGHGNPLNEDELKRIHALGLSHLHQVVDLSASDWSSRLDQVAAEAAALDVAIELEVLTNDDGTDVGGLMSTLPALVAPVARVTVFPRSDVVSTDEVLRAARAARDRADVDVPIGGGSRAYFTQLNRNVPSAGLLDFVAYALNPQVHAFDNASIVETLAAQAETVHSAKAITGDVPVVVGPITLRPRINPDAVPTTEKLPPGTLPDTVDPRQSSLFAAGWTVGSIRYLAGAGVAALTYYETTGWRGVMERSDHELRVPAFHSRPGMAFPVYHVLADVGEFAEGRLLDVDVSDRLAVEALALVAGDRFRLIVASFLDHTADVQIVLPRLTDLRRRTLDDTSYDDAADDPVSFQAGSEPLTMVDDHLTVSMRPFAVVTIDGRWEAD